MSLKDEGHLPNTGRPTSLPKSHTKQPSAVSALSSTIIGCDKQSALHCHSKPIHQSLPIVNELRSAKQEYTKTGKIPTNRPATGKKGHLAIPRRTQLTSQGTVVINRATSNQKDNDPNVQADAAAVDDIRRQAEVGYYEQRDARGFVRRRSMIRTVSNEDYLLGRGANPRTGLVTPGHELINGSINARAVLHNSNVTSSAKWKQRGDQWVSLDIEEPSSIPSTVPVHALPLPKVRNPGTTERFTQWNASVPNFASSERKRSQSRGRTHGTISTYTPAISTDQNALPGSFPNSPPKQASRDLVYHGTSGLTIPRKPVGGPPPELEPVKTTINSATYDNLVHAVPQHTSDANRKMSTPSPYRNFTSPADVGKELPKLPGQLSSARKLNESSSKTMQQKTFLETRSQTWTNLYQFTADSPTLGWPNMEKQLPCLPMNSGLFPPAHSSTNSITTRSSSQTKRQMEDEAPTQHEEEQKRTESPNRRSHIAEMMLPKQKLKQSRSPDYHVDQTMNAVPTYDNPPAKTAQRLAKHQVGGPRAMPKPRHVPAQIPAASNILVDPCITTFTNTDTSTHASRSRAFHQQLMDGSHSAIQIPPPPRCRLPPRPGQMNSQCQTSSTFRMRGPERAINLLPQHTHQTDFRPYPSHPTAVANTEPFGAGEPDLQHQLILTERHNRLKTTGTPGEVHRGRKPRNRAPKSDSRIVKPRLGEAFMEISSQQTSDAVQGTHNHPTRRCSRCHNGFVKEKASSTDGNTDSEQPRSLSAASANAPEVLHSTGPPSTITEVTEPRSSHGSDMSPVLSATSATILDVEEDLRDHSVCCPDCCKLGCHEGCLGHPSRCASPASPGKDSKRSSSGSTATSSSAISFLSDECEDQKHKFSFVKSVLKFALGSKRTERISRKASEVSLRKEEFKSSPRGSIQSTTTSPKAPHPTKEPPSSGATAAARKAIGLDCAEGSDEDKLAQLPVSKKRSSAKRLSHNPSKKDVDNKKKPHLTHSSAALPANGGHSANDSRKISSSRPCSISQLSLVLHPSQARNTSEASLDIRMPAIENMGLINLSQILLVVPYDAVRMWLRNNPQIKSFGWQLWNYMCSMGLETTGTARMLLNAVYYYSKTGRVRMTDTQGNEVGVQNLVAIALRSALFIVVLASLLLILSRIAGVVILPLRLLISLTTWLCMSGRRAVKI